MRLFRCVDARHPFLWQTGDQPAGRWHAAGDGPAQYFADTPDGAWAEFLRHEGITDVEDLRGIARALWSVDVDLPRPVVVDLPSGATAGGVETYQRCQERARELRDRGAVAIEAPSAALVPGAAGGHLVREGRLAPGSRRDGAVVVAFSPLPDVEGWRVVDAGHPPRDLLDRVRPL